MDSGFSNVSPFILCVYHVSAVFDNQPWPLRYSAKIMALNSSFALIKPIDSTRRLGQGGMALVTHHLLNRDLHNIHHFLRHR